MTSSDGKTGRLNFSVEIDSTELACMNQYQFQKWRTVVLNTFSLYLQDHWENGEARRQAFSNPDLKPKPSPLSPVLPVPSCASSTEAKEAYSSIYSLPLRGAGKSLGLMASCSIYGLEKGLRLIKGDTPVAKAIAMGVLCNLPIIYDEIMDQDPEAIRKQVDVFRDGRDRSRGTVDGTIRQVQSSWTTIQISAGNGSLFDLLSNDGTDAPVFRVFEIEPKLPSGTDAAYGNRIRKQLLDNAGHAGDIYLRYLTSPGVVDWVKARLDRRIEDVWDKLGPVRDQRQRIRVHFLACLWVACDVVTGIGLLEFDVGRIMAYAFQEMDRMVSGTSEQKDAIAQAPDLIGRFLNEHVGEVLTVAEPFRHGKQCSVMGRPPLRRVIMRHELASSRLLIAVKPFGDWMIKHTRLPARDAATALEKLGVVTRKKHRATLGAGTDFASAPVDCIELDMAHPLMSGKLRVVEERMAKWKKTLKIRNRIIWTIYKKGDRITEIEKRMHGYYIVCPTAL